MTPRLIPWLCPKSSALTITRRLPTMVPANPDHRQPRPASAQWIGGEASGVLEGPPRVEECRGRAGALDEAARDEEEPGPADERRRGRGTIERGGPGERRQEENEDEGAAGGPGPGAAGGDGRPRGAASRPVGSEVRRWRRGRAGASARRRAEARTGGAATGETRGRPGRGARR